MYTGDWLQLKLTGISYNLSSSPVFASGHLNALGFFSLDYETRVKDLA